MNENISLIPYTCGAGASVAGCEQSAVFLDKAGIIAALSEHVSHADIKWHPDPHKEYEREKRRYANLPPLRTDARRNIVLKNAQALAEKVKHTVRKNRLPVIIGGDHSSAAGSVAGLAHAHQSFQKTGVIWFDAHPDLNIRRTSPSYAYHGMSLSALLGKGDPQYASISPTSPVILPEHVIYIGLRDIDAGEQQFIDDMNIKVFTMNDIYRNGVYSVLNNAVKHLSQICDRIVLSVDLDAFDTNAVTAVGSPVPGGIDTKEALHAFKKIDSGRLDMIELVEFNPTLKGAQETGRVAVAVLQSLLSH